MRSPARRSERQREKEQWREPEPRRVLAVASGGGHWIQLRRLRPAWAGCAVTYVTTRAGYRDEVAADAADAGGAAGEGAAETPGNVAGGVACEAPESVPGEVPGEMPGEMPEGPPPRFFVVPDAHRCQPVRLVCQLAAMAWIVLRTRPHAVVTTGAAPGYFAVRLGRLLGARTVWVDSIANAEELSLSGQRAGPHVDLWLTQWKHLAAPEGTPGPRHSGAVL